MLKNLYAKILNKLQLSNEQLDELAKHLTPEEISAWAFVKDKKMCPNTKALEIKLNGNLIKDKQSILLEFKKVGISNIDLSFWFLILYDLPSIISKRWQKHLLQKLRQAALDLKKNIPLEREP